MNADLDDEVIEISDTESGTDDCRKSTHKRKRSDSSSDSDSTSSSEGVVWLDEESESETELDCDYWDQDCIVLTKSESDLRGYHLMPTCSFISTTPMTLDNTPELNTNLQNTNRILNIQTNWENHNAFNETDVEIITEPWRACLIHNFLQNPSILTDIRQDFNEVKWRRRTLDLYEFFQSDDLVKVNLPSIKKLYNFICGDLKTWVSTITGLELSEVSATCSFYSETDFLLVHDDQRGNRAVAFVIYITGDVGWQPEWGGALQLLSRDDTGQPTSKTVRNIYPRNNQIVLFPVTDHSFHQVLEVTASSAHPRLSINGWFHTPTSTIYDSPVTSPGTVGGLRCARYTRPQYCVSVELKDWITSPYLELRTAMQVQTYMEDSSEISLDKYIEKMAFNQVWSQISRQDLKWASQGPLNRRHYSTLIEEHLPEKLVDFINLFKSGEFFKLLNEYTAVDFDHMRYEVQRWEQGNYDLLGNRPESVKGMRLDVILYLCHGYDQIDEKTVKNIFKHRKISNNDTKKPKCNTKISESNDESAFIVSPDSTIPSNDIDVTCGKVDSSTYPKSPLESAKVDSTDSTRDDSKSAIKTDTLDCNTLQNNAKSVSPSTSAIKDILNDTVGSSNDCHKQNKAMPNDIIGGKLIYVDIKEIIQNALVTVVPNNNTINFVYGDTSYFTSYLSKKNPVDSYFYVIFASYYEGQKSESEVENQTDSDSD